MASVTAKTSLYRGMEQWKIRHLRPIATKLNACLSGLRKKGAILFSTPDNYKVRLINFELLKVEQLSSGCRMALRLEFHLEQDGGGPYQFDSTLYNNAYSIAFNRLITRLRRIWPRQLTRAERAFPLYQHEFELRGIPSIKLERGTIAILYFGGFDK